MRRVPESARPTGPGMGCALALAVVVAVWCLVAFAVVVHALW